jgi:hypothetical protein
MFKDEIDTLRRIIMERQQENTRHKRQVRVRASASISLGVLVATALTLTGGIWFEKPRQLEEIDSPRDHSQVTDTATLEELGIDLQNEVFSLGGPPLSDHILQAAEFGPLDKEGLLPAAEEQEESATESVLVGSHDTTSTPDPSNELQQIELPAEKPRTKVEAKAPLRDMYGVQLASVLTERDAVREKARLERRYHDELENLKIYVETVTLRDVGTRYRIVAGMMDKESAAETCRRLNNIGKQCLLMKVAKTENGPP